jgi:predicted protein tyrosine phosphatase
MTLVVCPAASLSEICRLRQPSHLIRMRSPDSGCEVPQPGMGVANRLDLAFHDIAVPQPGLVAPDAGAIAAILHFAAAWDGARPLVVSCFAGVSRSPAAAFILACARAPGEPEREIALRLRHVAPIATPNAGMVALADDALGREGRMIAAIAAIGRGADYTPYRSFDFL